MWRQLTAGTLSDDGFRTQVYDEICDQYGIPSICIPAAGITLDALAVKLHKDTGKAIMYPRESFERVVNINLIAPVYWAMEMISRIAEDRALRGMKKWRPEEHVQGTVVFIGSVSSQGGQGPDFLRINQGRPGGRGSDPDEGSDLLRRSLRSDPSRIYRYPHGAGAGVMTI